MFIIFFFKQKFWRALYASKIVGFYFLALTVLRELSWCQLCRHTHGGKGVDAMTTYDATRDDKFSNMTTLGFQWGCESETNPAMREKPLSLNWIRNITYHTEPYLVTHVCADPWNASSLFQNYIWKMAVISATDKWSNPYRQVTHVQYTSVKGSSLVQVMSVIIPASHYPKQFERIVNWNLERQNTGKTYI